MWLQHQTMLINEMRLTPVDPKARQFLESEMEKFFFGEGSQRPEGYVPPEDESERVPNGTKRPFSLSKRRRDCTTSRRWLCSMFTWI